MSPHPRLPSQKRSVSVPPLCAEETNTLPSLPSSPLSSAREGRICYICMEDENPARPVPLSPCQCRGRRVHTLCLKHMIAIRQSRTCPVCRAHFRNVSLSMRRHIHWGWTLYNACPLLAAAAIFALALYMWDRSADMDDYGIHYLFAVSISFFFASGSTIAVLWFYHNAVRASSLVIYTWIPSVQMHVRETVTV